MDKDKDKDKECDVPASVFTGGVTMETGEKHPNLFKEPAGMTTICLSDAPIPDERKIVEKFTLVNGARRYTKLVWIPTSIILVLLVFTLYENEGLNIFQSTEPHELYPEDQSNITLLSNSINDMERYEYTTPSTEPKDKVSTTEVTLDVVVDTGNEEGYTKLENSISGTLVINPHFLGMVAANSESSDKDPTDLMNLLNIFGYAGEISVTNREKRSQQNDNVDVVIAAPPNLDENCNKNISSNNSNINSEKEFVSAINGIDKDAAKDLKIQQLHKSNNESERISSEGQNKQEESSANKKDVAQSEITSSSKIGNQNVNTDITKAKDTTSLSDQVEGRWLPSSDSVNKPESVRISVGALTRETMNHENNEQNNKQTGTELLQTTVFPITKKPENKNIDNIKPHNISTTTTESSQKEKTQYSPSTIYSSYAGINKSENVVVLVTTQTNYYEEAEQRTTSKGITDILIGKKDQVQNQTNSFSEIVSNKSNVDIFQSVQPEYQATPVTEPSILKQTQSRLKGQLNTAENVHVSAGANQSINSTHTSDKQVNYEYFESEQLDNRDTDDIDDVYFPVTSKRLSSTHTTTVQPHVELDYTVDPYYEQERNSTHHISSQSTQSNPSSVSRNKATDEVNLQMKLRASTESNSNTTSIDTSTTIDKKVSTNRPFSTKSTSTLSAATDPVTSTKHYTTYFSSEPKHTNKEVFPAVSTTNFSQFEAYSGTSDTDKDNNQNLKLEQPAEDIVGMKKRTNSNNQGKQNVDATFSEQMQSNQMKDNHQYPCPFPPMNYPMPPPQYYYPPYPQYPPYPYPAPSNEQLKIVNLPSPTQQGPILVLNPPVMNYASPYVMPLQNPPQVGNSYGDYSPVGPIQSVDPKGQYYMCNAIPAPLPHIVTVPAVEVRKIYAPGLVNRERTFTHTEPLTCPIDHVSCSDNSRCIKHKHFCDGESDCKDGSDESNCSCRDRVDSFRRCDGYVDCPEGEDEVGCFGCSENEFSCNDWNPRYRRSTCIPLEQRCDGIEQCPIGFDEIDCSVLTDTLQEGKLHKVSNAVGFLNRNYKGKWYPTCFGTEVWAAEVCKTESGPNPHHLIPESRLAKFQDDYKGPYIEETQNEGLHLKDKCAMEGTATFVRCPPLICGMRLKIYNPYRIQEIETSHEILEEMPPDEQFSDNVLGDSRIVGGDGSQPASWPWVVTIYKNGIFHCSGVIINELWIVSAAHCVDKYWLYYYEIQAGVLRRFSYAPQTQIRWVTHAVPYLGYNKSTLQNDIALLKLSAPLRYNRYVRPICLPSESTAGADYFNAPYPGTECTVVGWGATSEHSADPDHLREVRVPVLPVCKYEEDRETNAICAGFTEGGRDACQGDSGGPFMCLNPNRPHQWYLAGVVSHGEGCARADEPGIYTRVSLYVEWIMEYVNSQQPLPPQTPLQKCPGYICRETNRCISKKRQCDRIVDCLHGDDELNCYGWQLKEYFKHMDYLVGSDLHSALEDSEEDDGGRDLIVREPLNPTFSLAPKESRFMCKKLFQSIPQNKRCNKVVDCEDGTDEMGCTCRDYLLTTASSAICDGITDCADLSDETNCVTCDSTEFQCRLSKSCIPLKKRCDRKTDCPNQEDEWDCVALTNGTTVILDSDGRPELRNSGIFAINDRGNWTVTCTSEQGAEEQASIAALLCSSLGFIDYTSFKSFSIDKIRNRILQPFYNQSTFVQVRGQKQCTVFYIKCTNEITHPKLEQFGNDWITLEEQFYTPWIAQIHVNGSYQCTGVLVNLSWVLTSTHCFQHQLRNQSFLTVLLGNVKGNLVQGPFEQIVAISNHFIISDSTAVLLQLHHPANHTRYVRPIALQTRTDANRERCLASDVDKYGSIKSVKLQPVAQKCKEGFKCIKRSNPANKTCESTPWSGVIVCESGGGWYSSALFTETEGYCGFRKVSKYPAVNKLINKIQDVIRTSSVASLPKCDGFRCKLGQCIENSKVCDGVPDCRNAEDEDESYCTDLKNTCQSSNNCTCSKWELRCANGKCVPKMSFCDQINDCGDWSDEPKKCSCKAYLKLSEPSKICDGIVHCRDSGDERLCTCDGSNFRCERSSTCVANATVCDGVYDCPNGEDEDNCFALKPFEGTLTSGEVITRTAGEWHSGCFPPRVEQRDINTICTHLSLKSNHSQQLRTDKPEVTGKAVFDRFRPVQLSRKRGLPIWVRIRSGVDPYITFKNNTGKICYKLFVDC